jgi:hypothetical protein
VRTWVPSQKKPVQRAGNHRAGRSK